MAAGRFNGGLAGQEGVEGQEGVSDFVGNLSDHLPQGCHPGCQEGTFLGDGEGFGLELELTA